jgi:hypothetical protein
VRRTHIEHRTFSSCDYAIAADRRKQARGLDQRKKHRLDRCSPSHLDHNDWRLRNAEAPVDCAGSPINRVPWRI